MGNVSYKEEKWCDNPFVSMDWFVCISMTCLSQFGRSQLSQRSVKQFTYKRVLMFSKYPI